MFPFLFYQIYLSPFFGGSCRFQPSCSQFGMEAVRSHGWRGFFLTILRISKCHPFCKGGYDPVPPNKKFQERKPIELKRIN